VGPTAQWTCDTWSRSNVPYIHEVLILLEITDRNKSAFDPEKFKIKNCAPKASTIPLDSDPYVADLVPPIIAGFQADWIQRGKLICEKE
jgi:hypothetical protein